MTAAELALGLLDGEERAAALRRVLAEPGFASEAEAWRAHFGSLFAHWPEQVPPAGLLGRIERSITPDRAPARFWPAATGAMGLVAAGLLLVIVLRPPSPAPTALPPQTSLVAVLSPARPGAALPALYDPARGELRVSPAALAPAGRSAQLWMIDAGGTPHPLGLLNAAARTVIPIAPADRAAMTPGLALAVSSEPLGGSPSALPTGPIVASGTLISS